MNATVRLVHLETPVVGKNGEVSVVKTVTAKIEPLVYSYCRLLTEADFDTLTQIRSGERTAQIRAKTLKTKHHEIARYMAMGMSTNQIAAIFNMSATTISMLKHNPAFSDLLHYYMAERDKDAVNLSARLRAIALDATDKLQECINSDEATPEFVRKSLETVLDRIGIGPQVNHNVSGGVDVRHITDVLAEPGAVRQRPILDVTPTSETSEEPSVGQVHDGTAAVGEEPSQSGGSGEGEGI